MWNCWPRRSHESKHYDPPFTIFSMLSAEKSIDSIFKWSFECNLYVHCCALLQCGWSWMHARAAPNTWIDIAWHTQDFARLLRWGKADLNETNWTIPRFASACFEFAYTVAITFMVCWLNLVEGLEVANLLNWNEEIEFRYSVEDDQMHSGADPIVV